MERRSVLLSVGIVDLAAAYVTFTNQQYFSPFSMAGTFLLALLAALLFLLPYSEPFKDEGHRRLLLYAALPVSLALIYYEVFFNLPAPGFFGFVLHVAELVTAAVLLTVGAMHATGKLIRDNEHGLRPRHKYAIIAVSAIIASAVAYLVMYGFSSSQWNGVDELAYNFYAATLFLHGHNPYIASMQPVLNAYHIYPTVQLDGTYEYAYDYPALSFLVYVPIIGLGVTSFYIFVYMLLLISAFAAMLVYYKSGFNAHLMLPLGLWLFASYTLVSVSNAYLAVSFFLLLAYLAKGRARESGALLGLAASTTQLAWFALPYFYVLSLRQQGRGAALRQVLWTAAAFIAVNIYFIAISPPAALGNIFALFSLNRLMFYGPNLAQFFETFYQVPFSYISFVSVTFMAFLLLLLYIYPKSLKPLVAIAPMMIFFLSWRNISIYGLPYIPLLLLVYFHRDGLDNTDSDLLASRRRLPHALAALLIVYIAAAAYAHGSYLSGREFDINRIVPVLVPSQYGSQYQPYYALAALDMSVSSYSPVAENVSFYVASRSPNLEGYVLGSTVARLGARGTATYVVNYSLPLVNGNTRLVIFAFSGNYIAERDIELGSIGLQVHPAAVRAANASTNSSPYG